MSKILQVAQREYTETVKTKTFLIGLLMVPVMIGGIILFAGRFAPDQQGPRPAMRVPVTDLSNTVWPSIQAAFDQYNQAHPDRKVIVEALEAQPHDEAVQVEAKDRLRQRQIDAYIVLDRDVVTGSGKARLYTFKPTPADLERLWTIEGQVQRVVVEERCKARNITPEVLAEIRNVSVERVDVGSTDEAQRVEGRDVIGIKMMIPFFFMYLMFMGIAVMGKDLLNGIIEEKNSRIIEVLLSALSPFELMAGKILGLGAVSLTVIGLWAGGAYGAARWLGLPIEITAGLGAAFVIYYVLGFLLFSSILMAAGSVCNSLKETQSLMMPIMLVCIVPMLAWMRLVQDPHGSLARTLSFVPPMTPMVMILRLASTPDIGIGEVLFTMALLAGTVLGAIWAAAKVFRTGILMYGKRPGFSEIVRWLRQS